MMAKKGTEIHPTAILEEGVELGVGVKVDAYARIGRGIQLHDGVTVGVGAILGGDTVVGQNTKIYPYATVGSDPQDLKFKGERTRLIVGSDNLIREYVNISLGTAAGGGVTTIGDHNLIMVYSHIAHDCHIGSHCVFANGVHLAGHITVEDSVVFGGMSGGHQFCRFGEFAMVAAGAIVVQDVTPYSMVQGDRAAITGLNVVGLRRSGIAKSVQKDIKHMFKVLYQQNLTLDEAAAKISMDVLDSPQKERFLAFLHSSKRGLCR